MKNKLLILTALILFISCSPVRFSTVNDSPPPPSPCTDPTCVDPNNGPFTWIVGGDWGICSEACGGGSQSRIVYCQNSKEQKLPDDYCKDPKPASQQPCNTQACPTAMPSPTATALPFVPFWNVGPWGLCSAACNGGTQTRIVECRSNTGVVADALCTSAKPSPVQDCNMQACPPNTVTKTKTVSVPADQNKVDILLVVDDSSSMEADGQRLSQRMTSFVNGLQASNVDWQMCVTTTDVNFYQGRPIKWSVTNNVRALNKNSGNLSQIFQQTMYDIFHLNGTGSNDEQGVRAMLLSLLNNTNYPCYRQGAALAVIVIADEDERSVGGNASLSSQQYQPLSVENYPVTYINNVKAVFGADKKMVANAIVTLDENCRYRQNLEGSPSYIGTKYIELANMTGGPLGNICDLDYSANLQYFKEAITNTLSSITLDCAPYGAANVNLPSGYNYQVTGNVVTFNPVLPGGTTVTVTYQCVQ